MNVASHIKSSALFNKNYKEINKLYSNLIVGRSIHFFVQFVEPELLVLFPEYALVESKEMKSYSSKRGSLNLGKLGYDNYFIHNPQFARDNVLLTQNANLYISEWQNRYLLYYPISISNTFLTALNAGYNSVSSTRLHFLLELSIGLIVVNNIPNEDETSNFIKFDHQLINPLEIAHILVVKAAKNYINLWLKAELFLDKIDDEFRAKYSCLTRLFALSILYEYQLRTDKILKEIEKSDFDDIIKSEDLLEFLGSFDEIPMVAEIVACWYPFWNRGLFIFGSPFDHTTRLKK